MDEVSSLLTLECSEMKKTIFSIEIENRISVNILLSLFLLCRKIYALFFVVVVPLKQNSIFFSLIKRN